jgi:hypothetical protein
MPQPQDINFETMYAVANRTCKDVSKLTSKVARQTRWILENQESIDLNKARLDRIEDHQTRQLELLAAILVRLTGERAPRPVSDRE